MTKSRSVNGGNFLAMLAILFIGLKLTGHITWSWWLVLAPLWVLPAVLVLIVTALVSVNLVIAAKKGNSDD